jgi:hypothetical protein
MPFVYLFSLIAFLAVIAGVVTIGFGLWHHDPTLVGIGLVLFMPWIVGYIFSHLGYEVDDKGNKRTVWMK